MKILLYNNELAGLHIFYNGIYKHELKKISYKMLGKIVYSENRITIKKFGYNEKTSVINK